METGATVLAYFAIGQLVKAIVDYGRDMLEYSKERELFLGELEPLGEILSRLELLVESKSQSVPPDPWIEALQKLDLFKDNATLGHTLRDIASKLDIPKDKIYTRATKNIGAPQAVELLTPSGTHSDGSLTRKVVSGAHKIKVRSIWALIGKSDMIDLLARVQRMCQMAQIALSAYSAEQLTKMSETVEQRLDLYQQQISAKLDEGLVQIHDQLDSLEQQSQMEKDDKRLQDFIMKLQPVDNETKHHSISAQKQTGTCNLAAKPSLLCILVIFGRTRLVSFWSTYAMTDFSPVVKIVIVQTTAGSGKSVLWSVFPFMLLLYRPTNLYHSSSVIEELESSTLTQVIYHYCDFRDQHSTNVKTIFHSLLAQLVRQNTQQFNKKLCQITDSKLNISGLLSTIDRVVDWIIDDLSSRDKQQYVVIDALDECEDFDCLIPCLLRLASVPKVSLLLSSRQERDIYDLLCDQSIISLADEGASVLADITIHIDHELKGRQKLSRFPSPVKADIARALMEKSDGMFRWVQCQLDSLVYCRTAGAVKEALANLPKTLYETYEHILYSIDAKGPTEARTARQILQWIIGSTVRPLTLTEINSALQIEIGQPKLNEDFCLFDEEEILSICKSLVMCNSGVVSLSHFTVKEFLVQARLADLNLGHYAMVNSVVHHDLSLHCLTYLLLDAFKMGPATSKESYAQRLRDYPFLPCATIQLPAHLSSAPQNDPEIYALVSQLLLDPTLHNFSSFSQTEHFMDNIGYTSQNYYVLRRNPSFINSGQSPPWFIVWCRTPWIARRLLHERPEWLNAESTSSTFFCGTPLHWAIYSGCWDIAEAILDSGANIDKKSVTGVKSYCGSTQLSPLQAALGMSSGEGVKLLLARGAKVSCAELKSAIYRVPRGVHVHDFGAMSSVHTGDPRMVQTLLDAGCDPKAIDPGSGKSTLQAAFELRTAGVIDVLIKAGASLEEVTNGTRNAFMLVGVLAAPNKFSNTMEELQIIRDFLMIALGLPLNVATLVMDLAEQWANIRVSKNETIEFTEDSAETPYIRLAMPNGNLRSIIFITSSHDQGYSGEPEHTKGTYQESHTWFEAAIMRQGEQVGDRRFIQANVQAASQSRTHRNIWSVDEIWMLPRARYAGWINNVDAAEITICYTFC
ncbi:hypothetical protein BDP27DRAFT_1433254 [Rhodocollybia butyracea]|uniref:Uncharacterized protein n=1 Tax=Rhodocollybia butyracea TaxID=206335 RepID=A0A9P5P6K5_9AGAR|nr:hypothetical protein BDP27DRAFT_1433254 [Rhodocollybia butyracea]